MSGAPETLSSAIDWLLTELERTPYGRLSIGVQVHDGRIAKVFKSIEESTIASQTDTRRAEDVGR